MLTCFYDLQRLLGATCSQEEANYDPLTRFALMALARKNHPKRFVDVLYEWSPT